jgi:hypothetical protein
MSEIQSKTKKDFSPFLGLEKSKHIFGKHSEFYDLFHYPNLIVRKSFIGVCFSKKAKEFQEVVQKCHLFIPKTWYVVGHDPVSKEPSLFAVTEQVNGKKLNEIFLFDKKEQEELDTMYTSLCLYLWKTYCDGGYVLSDFRNEQIIFGTVSGEKEKRLFLADVDPIAEFWEKRQRENYFWEYLYRIAVSMKQTEFDGNFHAKSRKRIKRIFAMAQEPENSEGKQYRADILRILNV